MISDQERREVAAKLREKKSEFFGVRSFFPQDMILYQSQYLKAVEECMPDGDCFFDMLAELIDRPTCRNAHDGREFECSECGMQWHLLDRVDALDEWAHVRNPGYCPSCGAEVVK